LAGVAGDFGHALFVAVQFFQNDHGQKNVMLFKSEETHRVVHQHIGVKYKQLGGPRVLWLFNGFWLGRGMGAHASAFVGLLVNVLNALFFVAARTGFYWV